MRNQFIPPGTTQQRWHTISHRRSSFRRLSLILVPALDRRPGNAGAIACRCSREECTARTRLCWRARN